MDSARKFRAPVILGIRDEIAVTGDHLAFFYESDEEFEEALGFVDVGLRGTDHCMLFGIPDDITRFLTLLEARGWNTSGLMAEGRLSTLRPELTCDATVTAVSRHMERVFSSGATFVRFIGNAAVGQEGWPDEDEFFKLEASVSAATLNLPCVAMCMFDLRSQSAKTIMKAAFEGHPVTIHRNCIRENPYYVPRGR